MKQSSARPRSWRCLCLAPALLLLGVGCSNAETSASAYPDAAAIGSTAAQLPPAPVYDPSVAGSEGYFEDESYDFADDLAGADAEGMREERAMMGNVAPPARDAKGRQNDAAKQQAQRAADAKAGEGDPEAAIANDDAPEHGRQIVYIAGLQLSVFNLETAMQAVERIPDQYGGWIHMRNQQQVVLRLPAFALKPVMAQIANLGVVEARTLQAQDVTAEYVDLESRIKVLRETQAQLLELLGQAKNVEEALHVRRALDDVTMQLETALGRMRQLGDLIAFSTLTVTLAERGPQERIPTSNDPFRWVDNLGVEATEWR